MDALAGLIIETHRVFNRWHTFCSVSAASPQGRVLLAAAQGRLGVLARTHATVVLKEQRASDAPSGDALKSAPRASYPSIPLGLSAFDR